MGAWGYAVFENDAAGDFMDGIIKKISKPLSRKQLDCHDYGEIRAACKLLHVIAKSGFGSFSMEDEIEQAVECLDVIRKDREWIESWNSAPEIKREINKEFGAIKRLYENIS